jgi:osmotically-inducible protein OsmY
MGTAPTEFAEVIKVRFGAPLNASDGPAGVVAHVVVDPATRIISHVGVKLSRLGGRAYDLPAELIDAAAADAVTLSIARAEIPLKAQETPQTFARLSGATAVAAGGKPIGKLVQLTALRDTLALHRLIVDRGLRGEVVVPVDAATMIDGRRTEVGLGGDEVRALTGYRPDEELLRDIESTLFDYPRLRIDLRGMRLRAIDGDVWLLGHISSDLNGRIILDLVRAIAGVAAIHDELVADPDLAAAVAAALGRDERTRGQHIGVYPRLGEVRLAGVVETPAARQAATAIAESVPGVERVANELVVRPGSDVVPTFAGVTGEEDIIPGGG